MKSIADKNRRSIFNLNNIYLSFGNLSVFNNLDFSMVSGEIHALVGEHGAGKSSLAKVISGHIKPDAGELVYNGQILKNYTIKDAKKRGIKIVSQNNHLFDQFTVANNIMIDKSSSVFKFYNHGDMVNQVNAFIEENNIALNPNAIVRDLNLSDRVMVNFIKNIMTEPSIIILDETLEQLSNIHLQKALPLIDNLKKKGASIFFITHRVDDIYDIADRVSIMRDGKILVTEDVAEIDKINLIKLAYTQVIKEHSIKHVDPEFYQILKYNEAILTNLPFALLVTDTKNRVRQAC